MAKKKTINVPKVLDAEVVVSKNMGAGRTPKALQLKKYEHVLKRLDDKVDDVLDTLFDLLESGDDNVKLRVAEMLLKKYLPDKKQTSITGANGSDLKIQNINIDHRTQIVNLAQQLDDLDLDELEGNINNGNFKDDCLIGRGEGEEES